MNGYENDIPAYVFEEIEKLYMDFKDRIFWFVHSRIMDENVAEDITQEIFLEAMHHYELFSQHSNKVGWLFAVAHFKMFEYFRRLSKLELLDNEEVMPEAYMEDTGYSQIELDIVLNELLTPEELLRFKRYFVWGEHIEEIAEKENISNGNMRVRLTRLKQKVFEAIDGSKTKKYR